MESDLARVGGVEHAVDDDNVEVQAGIEASTEGRLKATARRRAGSRAPGLGMRRRCSAAGANRLKAAR